MTKHRILLSVILLGALTSQSTMACDSLVDIPKSQFKEIASQIKNADELDLDAIFQYSKLLCADNSMLRDYARRIGLKSKNLPIRSHALYASLAEMENIVLKTYKTRGLSAEQLKYIDQHPTIVYSIRYRDAKHACLSLYGSEKCNPDYVAKVQGSKVLIKYASGSVNAALELGDDGTLTGELNNNKVKRIPVKIDLQ